MKKSAMTKPKVDEKPKRALMTPAQFDKALFDLIDQASTRYSRGGMNSEIWSDVSIRLERTRSLVREMMTDAERRAVK